MEYISEYYILRDNCRKGLTKHLEKAIAYIPRIEFQHLLDIGCGTGVPTIYLANRLSGIITAIDKDKNAILYLNQKTNNLGLQNKIFPRVQSLFEVDSAYNKYDLILCEGLLNVIGFHHGLLKIVSLLSKNGYIIIHDELKDKQKKIKVISECDCSIVGLFELNDRDWWTDYYRCLENVYHSSTNHKILELMKSDMMEANMLRKDPSKFQSIYYILKKN